MLLNKNDDIELHIDSVSLTGSGVGRYNGLAVFVPATAPGDFIKAHIIKAKKSYAVGKCIKNNGAVARQDGKRLPGISRLRRLLVPPHEL